MHRWPDDVNYARRPLNDDPCTAWGCRRNPPRPRARLTDRGNRLIGYTTGTILALAMWAGAYGFFYWAAGQIR